MPDINKMKKSLLFTLVLLLPVTGVSFGQHSSFYLGVSWNTEQNGGKYGPAMAEYFEACLHKELINKYPCATLISNNSVHYLLYLERERALLESDHSDENFKAIGSAYGCDYLVKLEITFLGNDAVLNAICCHMRTDKVLVRIVKQCQNYNTKGGSLDLIEKMAAKMVRDLKTREICSFTGNVDISFKSVLDTTENEEYEKYCNGGESKYLKITKHHVSSEKTWALEKLSYFRTTGTVKEYTLDEQTVTEEDGCYQCPSGRMGGRTYTEKTTTRMNYEGLSRESMENGVHVDDSRIELRFYTDSTYTLTVAATSKPGTYIETHETHAEGTCDNINTPPETKTKTLEAAAPIILGPYKGCALDPFLKQKETIHKTDPETGAEVTIEVHFYLAR